MTPPHIPSALSGSRVRCITDSPATIGTPKAVSPRNRPPHPLTLGLAISGGDRNDISAVVDRLLNEVVRIGSPCPRPSPANSHRCSSVDPESSCSYRWWPSARCRSLVRPRAARCTSRVRHFQASTGTSHVLLSTMSAPCSSGMDVSMCPSMTAIITPSPVYPWARSASRS